MPAAKRRYHRLSPTAWVEIRSLWEVGDVTLLELADRYAVSERTLQAHFAKHDTVKGAKAAELAAEIRLEVFKNELLDKDTLAARARDVRETAYRNATALEELVMTQVEIARKDPSQAIRVGTAIKGLAIAASALERLHNLKHTALGLDRHVDEKALPKLIIDCFTDGEIADMRAQQGDDEDLVGAKLVDEPSGADLGLEPRSRPEDDDVVALGFNDDNVVEEEPTPAMVVVRVDDEGCRLARDAGQSA